MRFEYLEPASIEEGIQLLNKYAGKAKVIAGGTDLLLQIRSRMMNPECVIDVAGIPSLNYINHDEEQTLKIGAATPIRLLETSTELEQEYPIISQAASQLGSAAIRNIATVGGNLCNALPSAEMAQPLMALSARVKIAGNNHERIVSLEDFFTGVGTTILKTGELLLEIQVPMPLRGTRGIYMKHSLRGTIDLAIVNVAVVLALEPKDNVCRDIKIVLGAVAPTPIRARGAEKVLMGAKVDQALIDRAAELASNEAQPRLGSIRGSVEYKKEMVRVLTRRLIREAVIGHA